MKKFDLPVDAMVITSAYVACNGEPILQISHEYDEDDGDDWQFHCGNGDYSMENMLLVRLSTILKIDASVVDVADLPVGHTAKRTAVGHPWIYTRT